MQSKAQFYIALLIFLFHSPLMAQVVPSAWGEIPAEDLQMEVYEAAPDANAVVLIDKGHYDLTERTFLKMTYHNRTKILKTAGFDVGDIVISYFSKDKYETIKSIKAQIILPDGTKISIPEADFFDEKLSDNWSAKKFTFPQLQVGAIIEYEYVLASKSITNLKTWNFQGALPVRESELVITLPAYCYYNFYHTGKPLTEASLNKKPYSVDINHPNFKFPKSGKVNQYRFVLKAIEDQKAVPYIAAISDYYTKMKFLVQQTPNGGDYMGAYTNWNGISKYLVNNKLFGQQYTLKQPSKKLLKALKPIINQTSDKSAQLESIYTYLLDHFKIVPNSSIYVEKSLNEHFKTKIASPNELNLMVVAAVNHLKIGTAKPVLISTRSNGKLDADYPYLPQFNRVLAHVELEDKELLVDVADPHLPIGYTDLDGLTKEGLIVEIDEILTFNNATNWLNNKPLPSSEVFVANLNLNNQHVLAGEVNMKFKGYSAARMKSNLAGDNPKKNWSEQFTTNYPNFEVSDFMLKNEQAVNEPLSLSASCDFTDAVQVMGDMIYINPIIYPTIKENPFKDKERKVEIILPYPVKKKQVISIQIPNGYEVDELPTSQRFTLDGVGMYQFQIFSEEGKIKIVSIFDLNAHQIPSQHYAALKNLFDIIVEKTGEQIVLRKKTDLVKNE